MRTDVLDLERFYRTRLGGAAAKHVAERVSAAWGTCAGQTVLGFGYPEAVFDAMRIEARRIAVLAPSGRGVSSARAAGEALVDEHHWPIASGAVDRVLVVHGLEETAGPRRLMREIWRVLADDGSAVVVAANRTGLWSVTGGTPFAAGRPYTKEQLERLLAETMFRASAWSRALMFPPLKSAAVARSAGAWERAGETMWPGLAGALLVEAQKSAYAPIGLKEPSAFRAVAHAVTGRAAAARRTARSPQPLTPTPLRDRAR